MLFDASSEKRIQKVFEGFQRELFQKLSFGNKINQNIYTLLQNIILNSLCVLFGS